MKRVLAGLTVLLIHTGAASAQQSGAKPFPSAADTGGVMEGPPAPAKPEPAKPEPMAGPPAPAVAAPAPVTPATPAPATPAPGPASPPPQPSDEYPPGYGPPPGYVRPRPAPRRYYGPPQGYAAPPPYYHRYPPMMAAPPPPRRVTDRPFTLGASAGFGGLSAERAGLSSSQSGFAYSAHLGIGLRPGLLLLWDIERSVVDRNSSVFSQTAQLAALQMFIGDKLYLKAGFGMAQADQDDLVHTGWGPALMAGIGLELVQGWNWSFDVESTVTGARYTIGKVDETWVNWSAIGFGINFF